MALKKALKDNQFTKNCISVINLHSFISLCNNTVSQIFTSSICNNIIFDPKKGLTNTPQLIFHAVVQVLDRQ